MNSPFTVINGGNTARIYTPAEVSGEYPEPFSLPAPAAERLEKRLADIGAATVEASDTVSGPAHGRSVLAAVASMSGHPLRDTEEILNEAGVLPDGWRWPSFGIYDFAVCLIILLTLGAAFTARADVAEMQRDEGKGRKVVSKPAPAPKPQAAKPAEKRRKAVDDILSGGARP